MTIHHSLALALTFSLLILSPAFAQSKEPVQKVEVKKDLIEIEVHEMDFRDLCDKIGEKLKINVLVSPGIEEKISLRLGTAKQSILFKVLGGITECRLEKISEKVFLFTRPPNNRVHLKGTTLHDLLLTLASSSSKNLVIAPTVPDTPVQSIKAKRFYPTELMAQVAQAAGCVVEKNGKYVRVLGPPKSINLGSKTNEIFFRFFIQPDGTADTKPTKKPEKSKNITVDVVDLELAKVLSQIGQKTGWVFVVNPKIQSKVTVTLRDIPPMDALNVILALTNCKSRSFKGVFRVDPVVKVSLTKKDIEIKALIKILSERLGRKIEIPAKLNGKVSVCFKDLPAEHALSFLISAVTEMSVLDEFGKALRLVDQPRRQAKKPSPNAKKVVEEAQFKKLKTALQKRDWFQIDNLFNRASTAQKVHYPKVIADFAKALPKSESEAQQNLLSLSKKLLGDVLQHQANEAYKALDFRRAVIQQQKLKREITLLKIKDRQEYRLVHHSLIQNLRYVDKQVEQLRPLKGVKLKLQGGFFNTSQYSHRLKNFVLISGRYYFEKESICDSEGRKIEDLTVYSITEKSVTLKFKDKHITLKRSPSK